MGWIARGNGSNDILEIAALALLEPGTSAVYAQHSFAVYRLATQARGARHIQVLARDYGHDLDAMFEAIARLAEHTSELRSIMRHSYAVFCLQKYKSQAPYSPPIDTQ